MLENIRAYIEEEYKNLLNTIRENKENYAKNELYIALKKKIMDAYLAKEDDLKMIVEAPIMIFAATIIGIFVGSFSTSTIGAAILFGFMDTCLAVALVRSCIKYKKHKRELKEGQEELRSSYPEYGMGMLINEFAIKYERERQDELRNKIYADETYAKGLYDILQDDNLIKKMKEYNYQLYKELFKDAFESEWETYLEEISKSSPSSIHLNDKEYLKEIEPIKLDLTPKREKSHNLAIK